METVGSLEDGDCFKPELDVSFVAKLPIDSLLF